MRARLLSGDKLARRRVKDIGRDDARVHARARAMNLDLVHARYSLSLSLSLSLYRRFRDRRGSCVSKRLF
jgi:hypothetical protein